MFNWWENDITFKLHRTLIARRLGQNLVMVDSPWNNGLQFGMVNDLEIFFWNLKRKEKWFFLSLKHLKFLIAPYPDQSKFKKNLQEYLNNREPSRSLLWEGNTLKEA